MATAIQAQRVENLVNDAEVEITVGTIDADLGWWQWKEELQPKLGTKLEIMCIPLRRIMRGNKPPGWTIVQARLSAKSSRLLRQAPFLSRIMPQFWQIYEWLHNCDNTKDECTAY